MKIIFKKFGQVLIYYFASMIITQIIAIILNIPLKFIIPNFNNLSNFIIDLLGLSTTLFVIFFNDGYSDKKFELKPLLIALGLLLCFVTLVSTIIGHAVYISGPTVYLANYILHLKEPMKIFDPIIVNRFCLYLFLLAFVLIYAPIMITANYLGMKFKKRKYKYTKN